MLHLPNLIRNPLPDALQLGLFPAHVEVVDVAVALDELGGEVDGVAAEEEVVGGRHGERVAHEGAAVEGEGAGHAAGDAGGMLVGERKEGGGGLWGDIHFGILAHVCDGRDWDAKVGYGAPEVCRNTR